ncbi:MAG: hypothetical protein P1U39_05520 [Legionellaceae bacterium]|nr:hypothetical protein [Legionellaceae bacterium]
MMMIEEALEPAGEAMGENEAQSRTWYEFFSESGQASYSFFAEGLSSVSRALAQAEPLPQGLERLPAVGVDNVEMYRVHGVVLSTGNVWQLMILRSVFPDIFSSYEHVHHADEVIPHNYQNEHWNYIQRYRGDDVNQPMYLERFRAFLQTISEAQNASNGFNDANDGDDLPTKIAKAIAQHYYTNLELTVADIQQAIAQHYGQPWDGHEFSLEDINNDFVSRIVCASIDNGRMELRTLLPYEGIVEEAVNELKHPPLTLQSVLAWMAAVWNKFVELLTDGWDYVFSPSNP